MVICCLTASLLTGASPNAFAQSSPNYFMPPAAKAPPPSHPSAPAASPSPSASQTQAQSQLPPVPQLPALPTQAAPPTPVVGVLSVPEVMQKSTAAQGVQSIIRGRQTQLATEAQQARAKIQAEQQTIVAQRSKLTDAQLEAKEQALQNEIAQTQTKFQARNQAIEDSGQVALGKIEAMLIAVIRQQAQARGMNLILHREQVALNVSAFDITSAVADELNKLLPSVAVPPSVVTPGLLAKAQAQAQAQAQGGMEQAPVAGP
jgi:Skp family chaperone for outer membrane proteins